MKMDVLFNFALIKYSHGGLRLEFYEVFSLDFQRRIMKDVLVLVMHD